MRFLLFQRTQVFKKMFLDFMFKCFQISRKVGVNNNIYLFISHFVTHVSKWLKFDTLSSYFLLWTSLPQKKEKRSLFDEIYDIWYIIYDIHIIYDILNIWYCKCSTKLLVFSKAFLKNSQTWLENTCVGYNVNVNVWL